MKREVRLLARPRAAGTFAVRFGDGFHGRIAEREQDFFGAARFFAAQFLDGRAEGCEAKISRAFGAIGPIQERGNLDELVSRFDEIMVEHLLSCEWGLSHIVVSARFIAALRVHHVNNL